MNNQLSNTMQSVDETGLVSREVELESASNDYQLAELSLVTFFREAVARGVPLPECLEGGFKILFRGKWEKGTRTATTTGAVKGSQRIGVRVGLKKKP